MIMRINRQQFNLAVDASFFELNLIPIVSETRQRSFHLMHRLSDIISIELNRCLIFTANAPFRRMESKGEICLLSIS